VIIFSRNGNEILLILKKSEDSQIQSKVIQSYSVVFDLNKSGMRRGRKGPQMEDFHFCELFPQKDIGLFCVFDGHAGMGCSKTLSTLFSTIFLKYWEKLNPGHPSEMSKAMVVDTGVEKSSMMSSFWREVYKEADDNLIKFEYEGSTATTLLVWHINNKRYLQCANIGDSSAFICINGDAVAISLDHSLKLKSERIRVKDMGITLDPNQQRLNGISVTRAFGDHFVKEMCSGIISQPYTSELYELGPQHTRVIVASDGLWDVISGQEAFDMIKDINDSSEASEKLLKSALSFHECVDNITIIVVNL